MWPRHSSCRSLVTPVQAKIPRSCHCTHARHLILHMHTHCSLGFFFCVYTNVHSHTRLEANKHTERDIRGGMYIHTNVYLLHTHTHTHWQASTNTQNMNHKGQHVGDEPFMFWDKSVAEVGGWGGEERVLQAKYSMFDLTERYFQNHIQKFQPSGHNYLIPKIRFSSSVIFSMSCDMIWGGWRAIVRVIHWLDMCCYVGVIGERERVIERQRRPWPTTTAAAGQAASQVARQATGINTQSLSWEYSL